MPEYKDRAGKTHRVSINLIDRKRLKEAIGLDLVEAAHDPDALGRMLSRISQNEELWQVLAVLEGTTADELMAEADGTTEEDAGTALLQAIIDFFPQSHPLREPLRKLVRKAQETQLEVRAGLARDLATAVEGLDIRSVLTQSAALTSG